MPIPKRYYEELQSKRQAEHRIAKRDTRRDLLRSGIMCVVWCFSGLLAFGFALHTTDPLMGQVFKWTAYVVTYGGITVTLARAYLRGERRGDW
ncbi:MAG TPA: hypothetical protein VGH98_13125 [Gemmatimonadaceae bacterium]|jgi:hypothetical protein